MKNCFGYVRVSTAKQGEGVSLKAQRDAILAFAERNDIVISQWFEELETAAKRGRPVFNAMLRLLKKRKAEGVVMHKIDRSARNFADWAKIGDLSDAGIDVHFAAENIDFRSRGGRLTADIQAVIAADYIRNLRDETIKGLYGRLKQGIYPFKAPIGYLDNGGGKVKTIDPVRGPLVKRAFELYATGRYSIRTLQTELKRLGLRNENGMPLTKGGTERMLRNPFYTGLIRIQRNGETFEGIHELLISANLFNTVQALKDGKAAKKVTRHNHAYRGLFRCRRCGWSMIPELQKGHVYYRCQQRDCRGNSIREEALEGAVTAILRRFVLPPNAITAITTAVEQWMTKYGDAAERQVLTLQTKKLEGRLESLTDALIDRLIDKETFNRRKEALLLERAELQAKLDKRQGCNPGQIRSFLERVKSLAQQYEFAPKETRRAIVEIATSNRAVLDKNVYLEPSKWLQAAQAALAVPGCAEDGPKSRRTQKLQHEKIQTLLSVFKSAKFERAEELGRRHPPES